MPRGTTRRRRLSSITRAPCRKVIGVSGQRPFSAETVRVSRQKSAGTSFDYLSGIRYQKNIMLADDVCAFSEEGGANAYY